MAERSLHVVAVVVILALGVAALKWWQKRKAGRSSSLIVLEKSGVSLVYFHSPSCGVCRTGQKPVLERTLARFGPDQCHLVAVDASERTDVAREWGVMTLPSTYVVDPAGEVVHVNNGLVSESALWQQVSGALR